VETMDIDNPLRDIAMLGEALGGIGGLARDPSQSYGNTEGSRLGSSLDHEMLTKTWHTVIRWGYKG
jgi:hypothetical protein